MKKGLLLLLIFIAFVSSSFTVPWDVWRVLLNLRFNIYWDEKLDDVVYQPIPTKGIKNLDGKIIQIEGFLIDEDKDNFILIIDPMLFKSCGGPPPESMIRIIPKQKIEVKSKSYCTLKGRFEFNTTNLSELPYNLNEAECLDCWKSQMLDVTKPF